MKLTIFSIIAAVSLLVSTFYFALKGSEKNGTIKGKDETIKVLQTQNETQNKTYKITVDSLIGAVKESKENQNQISINFDKTKLKGSGNIIIDTKQLQSLSCDTIGIIKFYNNLGRKEKKKYE